MNVGAKEKKIYKVSVGFMFFFIYTNERKKWKRFVVLSVYPPVDTDRVMEMFDFVDLGKRFCSH